MLASIHTSYYIYLVVHDIHYNIYRPLHCHYLSTITFSRLLPTTYYYNYLLAIPLFYPSHYPIDPRLLPTTHYYYDYLACEALSS